MRQVGVAAVDPSSWGHTIRLVLEFLRVKLIEFLEDSVSKELGVESSNTVDGMGAHDRQVGHPDLLLVALFDQRHPRDLCAVTRVLGLELLDVVVVDQVDQLEVSGQELANEFNGPFLKGFRKDSMVGVRVSVVNDIPCLAVGELLFID